MSNGIMQRVREAVAPVWRGWASIWEADAVARKPHDARLARVHAANNAWFERELQRPGATVEGAAPDAVNEAIADAKQKKVAAVRACFVGNEPMIRSRRQALLTKIDGTYQRLVVEMQQLREFDDEFIRYAFTCGGAPTAVPLADDVITRSGFESWRSRVQRVLRPPDPAPRRGAAENPLVLD